MPEMNEVVVNERQKKILFFMHRWNPPGKEFMKELRKKIKERKNK